MSIQASNQIKDLIESHQKGPVTGPYSVSTLKLSLSTGVQCVYIVCECVYSTRRLFLESECRIRQSTELLEQMLAKVKGVAQGPDTAWQS